MGDCSVTIGFPSSFPFRFWRPSSQSWYLRSITPLTLSLSSFPSLFPPNQEQARLKAIRPSFFVYRQIHALVLSFAHKIEGPTDRPSAFALPLYFTPSTLSHLWTHPPTHRATLTPTAFSLFSYYSCFLCSLVVSVHRRVRNERKEDSSKLKNTQAPSHSRTHEPQQYRMLFRWRRMGGVIMGMGRALAWGRDGAWRKPVSLSSATILCLFEDLLSVQKTHPQQQKERAQNKNLSFPKENKTMVVHPQCALWTFIIWKWYHHHHHYH